MSITAAPSQSASMLFRVVMTAGNWIQLYALAAQDKGLLSAFPRAYVQWLEYGNQEQWAFRVAFVCMCGTVSLLNYGRFTDFMRFVGSFPQGIMFLAMGLMFATTDPVQTGAFYLAPAGGALFLACVDAKRTVKGALHHGR